MTWRDAPAVGAPPTAPVPPSASPPAPATGGGWRTAPAVSVETLRPPPPPPANPRDIPSVTPTQEAARAPEANLFDWLRYGSGASLLLDTLPGYLFNNQELKDRGTQLATRIGNTVTGANKERGVPEIMTVAPPATTRGGLPAWLRDEGRNWSTALTFALDQNETHRAEAIRAQYPDAEFKRDDRGYLQVRYNRESPWAYINAPGISVQDPLDLSAVLIKNAPAARMASLPATASGRALTAGGTSAVTEYLAQFLGQFFGTSGPDAGDVAMAGVGGTAGQGLFDFASGYGPAVAQALRKAFGQREVPRAPLPNPSGYRENQNSTQGDGATRGTPEEIADLERQLTELRRRGPRYPEEVSDRPDVRGQIERGEQGIRVSEGERGAAERASSAYAQEIADLEAQLARARQPYFTPETTTPTNTSPPAQITPITPADDVALAQSQLEAARSAPMAPHDSTKPWRTWGNVFSRGQAVQDAQAALAAAQQAAEDAAVRETGRIPAGPIATTNRLQRALDMAGAEMRASAAERAARQQASGQAPPTPRADVRAAFDEQRIPASRGQVAQDVPARQREDDLILSGEPRALQFANEQAAAVEARMRELATRGQPPVSGSVDEAGDVLRNEVNQAFETLDDLADDTYRQAFDALAAEQVDRPMSVMLNTYVRDRLTFGPGPKDAAGYRDQNLTGYDVNNLRDTAGQATSQALRVIDSLAEAVADGGANFANVERTRQSLRRIADGATGTDKDGVRLLRQGFDEWLNDALTARTTSMTMRIRSVEDVDRAAALNARREAARRMISEARDIWRERAELFTQQSPRDRAGRTIATVIDPQSQLTGTQIVNSIFGSGNIAPAQALGAVKRIRQLALQREPTGRLATGPTDAMREFEGGGAMPPALQAMREAYWQRIFEPLRKRRENTLVPARAVAERLDRALNGDGKAITRQMHTAAEVDQMYKILQVLKYIERPPGANTSGTGPYMQRMFGAAMDGIAGALPSGIGLTFRLARRVFGGSLDDMSKAAEAQRRFSRPGMDVDFGRSPSGAAYGVAATQERRPGEGSKAPAMSAEQQTQESAALIDSGSVKIIGTNALVFPYRDQFVTLYFTGDPSAAVRDFIAGRTAPAGVFDREEDAYEMGRTLAAPETPR